MCGICGIASLGDAPPDRAGVEAMGATLAHRGPDSEGIATAGPVALAARRLAIIDLEHGDQPVYSEDRGVCVVQNGEIYNHEQLRSELVAQGHRFASRGDTEVLAHLYEQEGEGFLDRLRGMFAIALWDARSRRLLLARDPFGIKPLYYGVERGRLAFASELKALVALSDFSREVDPQALESFLTFNCVPAPMTIFSAARKLPAGHLLRWSPGEQPVVERWARPAPAPAHEVRREPAHALAAELRERMRDSVRAHLVSDVPVGVLLSGGVDSSLLAALAATESAERVSTFSIGFRERSFNELDLARLVAQRYRTDHHELVVSPDAAELTAEIAAAFDEPFADSSSLPTYLVSRLAASHVKVALSGEGGDELFGGYETYLASLIARRTGPAARALRPLVELLPSSSAKASFDYKAKRFVRAAHLPALERHHGFKEIFSPELRAELLGPQVDVGAGARFDPVDLLRARYAETHGAEELARLQDLDLGVYLVDDLLVKTDRMSMAHSLEVRVPFLDSAVADFAHGLATRHKVRGWRKKWLLRRAAAPLLPREITHAKKRGFSIPAAAWLRGELAPFAREVLSPERVRREGFFDPTAVARVLEDHVSGREDLSRQLWGLLSFSLWLEGLPSASLGRRSESGALR